MRQVHSLQLHSVPGLRCATHPSTTLRFRSFHQPQHPTASVAPSLHFTKACPPFHSAISAAATSTKQLCRFCNLCKVAPPAMAADYCSIPSSPVLLRSVQSPPLPDQPTLKAVCFTYPLRLVSPGKPNLGTFAFLLLASPTDF